MKKQLIYTFLAVSVVLLGIGSYVFAQQGPFGNEMNPAVCERFAERFNLNIEEVREFFGQMREENQAEMQERRELRTENGLDNLLNNEEISEEQRQLILEKREEIRENCGSLKDLSPEEREEKIQEMNEEMRNWAEENGIELQFIGGIMGGRGKGFRSGFGGPQPE